MFINKYKIRMSQGFQPYERLYRALLKDLDDTIHRPSLMSIDLKRKWDACSELLLLEAFQKKCIENKFSRELYSWVAERLHKMHIGCVCY